MQLHDKLWSFAEGHSRSLQNIMEQLGISKITAVLLLNRGIDDVDDARIFLNPEICHLHDPFLLKDMDKAVDRINRAIKEDENIWIYGSDYIGGITSIVILYRYFMSIGYEVKYYLNDKVKQKNVITPDSIDYIEAMGGDLIICTDCQVTTNEIIDYAYSKNIDIIIIDNIEYKGDSPESKAVLNPRRKECKYPYKMLSCAGISLKLVQGLSYDEEFSKQFENYIDIASIGTLADKAPITGENRVLTKIGADVIKNTTNPGLRVFLKFLEDNEGKLRLEDAVRSIASITQWSEKSDISSNIVKLLISRSYDEAMIVYDDLNKNSVDVGFEIERDESPICEIDMEINIKDIGFRLIEEINMLAPFGLGNPKPIFSHSKITLESVVYFGEKEEALKLLVQEENRIFDCIGTNLTKANIPLSKHEKIDLAFSLELNTFKNIETIQLRIRDLRRRGEEAYRENSLIHGYYQAFIDKIKSFKDFSREVRYKNIKDLRNIKNRAKYVIDNLESSDSNLILINTVDGLIDLCLLLSDTKNFELQDSISFNYPETHKKNIVVVNPVLTGFDLEEYENIYLYDIPLLEEEINMLLDSDKMIHVLYNDDECKRLLEFFKDSIPTRDDLAELYKYLKGGSKDKEIVYQDMIKDLFKMDYPKLRIGLQILSDAGLLDFNQQGECFSLKLLPPPEKKIDITSTKLYSNICSLRDRFKRYTKTAFTIDFKQL